MMKYLLFMAFAACTLSCKKNDTAKVFQPKTVYYRIKMIDKNGNVTISQVRSIEEK